MDRVIFGIMGGGWRTEFFLRIARELPDRFEVCGVVTRSEAKGREIENAWGVKTFRGVDDLLKHTKPSFVVVCIPREAAPVLIKELAGKGVAVLTETPPAADIEGLIEINRLAEGGAKIQVAEQYPFQPLHAARIAVAHSGKLGEISQVQLSVCHGYHAISLMRKLLGLRFENAEIRAQKFVSPVIGGPGRAGVPEQEKVEEAGQVIAHLDFGGKVGIYDFTGVQYFSWIRSQRFLVRGDRGEINDSTVRYLKDFRTPAEFDLRRLNAGENGNLEGYYLKGILAGEEWIYRNAFIPGRLTDDEIAVASCLVKMGRYVNGGPEFYSLAEASQDHYLAMMINEALRIGQGITTETQPWAPSS